MKKLYIVRHAKSSWEDFRLPDHDRYLLPMGIDKTKKIGNWLKKKKNVLPELIICSSAVRAQETAKILAEKLGYPSSRIRVDPNFYHAEPETILESLYELPDEVKEVMIVGHNTTFNDLANDFLDWKHQIENLPTSGVVAVIIKTSRWVEIAAAESELEFMIFPRMLKH